jgi:hypothetical protein
LPDKELLRSRYNRKSFEIENQIITFAKVFSTKNKQLILPLKINSKSKIPLALEPNN